MSWFPSKSGLKHSITLPFNNNVRFYIKPADKSVTPISSKDHITTKTNKQEKQPPKRKRKQEQEQGRKK